MAAEDDIAKNLYEVFVRERFGKGFDDDSASLPAEIRPKFHTRVSLYREAMLLLVLDTESKTQPELEQVLQGCERYVFGPTPTKDALKKSDSVKAAMAYLARLLNPKDRPEELTWGLGWFQEMGHTMMNPARLARFGMAWIDDYIALVKTIRQLGEKAVSSATNPA